MITKVQIFTTQLTIYFGARSLPRFLFTATLNTVTKWLAANIAVLFVSIASFLRVSPACVTKWLFSGAAVVLQSTFLPLVPKLGAVGNLIAIDWLTYWISVVDQCAPLDHWLPKHSLITQHEIYSLWAWWTQILSVGRPITSEDQCTSNQHLSYHEIKEHRSAQHVPDIQAFWDFVADSTQYRGILQ